MPPVTLACHAMATRFEVVLYGERPVALRAAGEAALNEIQRLEDQLSLFRPGSEIAHLNARAACEPVRVTPALFALLRQAAQLHRETGGVFDITIAPLVRCWGFHDGTGRLPTPEEVTEARTKVGMGLVHLNERDFTVRFAREGVMLDLGAIGKGYAIERAAQLLQEAGVTGALVHGGTSTLFALGHPPEAEHWTIAVQNPQGKPCLAPVPAFGQAPSQADGGESAASPPLTTLALKDEALSVSAVWGRCFEANGKVLGHVIDPRTGWPAAGAVLAAVVLPSATETDALSTALLTLGAEGHDKIAALHPDMRTFLVTRAGEEFRLETRPRGAS
jgi:FAD:protein FMN transferase